MGRNPACVKEGRRRWKQRHPEQLRESKNRYYLSNKVKWLERGWRKRGIKGFGLKEYESLFKLQNGVCAICQKPQFKGRRLAVDHHHKTGVPRSLLCDKCNGALGVLESSMLSQYLAYLKKWGNDV